MDLLISCCSNFLCFFFFFHFMALKSNGMKESEHERKSKKYWISIKVKIKHHTLLNGKWFATTMPCEIPSKLRRNSHLFLDVLMFINFLFIDVDGGEKVFLLFFPRPNMSCHETWETSKRERGRERHEKTITMQSIRSEWLIYFPRPSFINFRKSFN